MRVKKVCAVGNEVYASAIGFAKSVGDAADTGQWKAAGIRCSQTRLLATSDE
jgi:hypothetical protein